MQKCKIITNRKEIRAEICKNILQKSIGLMFSKKRNLIFISSKNSKELSRIHTLFVFFPIDAYWLNENLEVVDLKKNIKPFSINMNTKKRAKYLIETPNGLLDISYGHNIKVLKI